MRGVGASGRWGAASRWENKMQPSDDSQFFRSRAEFDMIFFDELHESVPERNFFYGLNFPCY